MLTQKQSLLALVFFFLNPVYLYWSLRIYADVPFSLLVMLCFYVFELWRGGLDGRNKPSTLYPAVMGLICGLGILMRFEGYLLAFATFVGIFVITTVSPRRALKTSVVFFLTAATTVLPWLVYRNPLTSSYFEEPAGRKYDFEMLLTYLVSYAFVLGIIPAASVIATCIFKKPSMSLPSVFKKYPHLVAFVLVESVLILAWPAAVPRLFTPIVPFLVIALVKGVDNYFNDKAKQPATWVLAVILAIIYVVAQNYLRLQFLGPHTTIFIFVAAVSAACTLSVLLKHRQLFISSATLSMLILSASTIYLHKDVYRSIKEVSAFALATAPGKIIHNDTAGIINWYFPKSEYKNFDSKTYLTQEYLAENKVDYIVLTNEFNPNMEIDLKKRPYLSLAKESKYQRGGKMFFTWLVKVQR